MAVEKLCHGRTVFFSQLPLESTMYTQHYQLKFTSCPPQPSPLDFASPPVPCLSTMSGTTDTFSHGPQHHPTKCSSTWQTINTVSQTLTHNVNGKQASTAHLLTDNSLNLAILNVELLQHFLLTVKEFAILRGRQSTPDTVPYSCNSYHQCYSSKKCQRKCNNTDPSLRVQL